MARRLPTTKGFNSYIMLYKFSLSNIDQLNGFLDTVLSYYTYLSAVSTTINYALYGRFEITLSARP